MPTLQAEPLLKFSQALFRAAGEEERTEPEVALPGPAQDAPASRSSRRTGDPAPTRLARHAQAHLTTRSGTNAFHSTLWYFNRNDAFTALNGFQPRVPGAKPPRLNRNQYGANLGGPVFFPKLYNGKNRTFFFGSWEHYKQNQMFPQNDTSSVPTMAQRRGDFSATRDNNGQLITIYDPRTGRMVNNQWVRDPFPGNRIDPSRFDPVGAKILSLYPEPNQLTPGSVAWQNNYFIKDNVTWYDFYNVAARIDQARRKPMGAGACRSTRRAGRMRAARSRCAPDRRWPADRT